MQHMIISNIGNLVEKIYQTLQEPKNKASGEKSKKQYTIVQPPSRNSSSANEMSHMGKGSVNKASKGK